MPYYLCNKPKTLNQKNRIYNPFESLLKNQRIPNVNFYFEIKKYLLKYCFSVI